MKNVSATLVLTALMALASCAEGIAADKPNIIIFLADDLGYADIGVNGCQDIPTPNVDSIAKNGVRFTDGYAAHPVCSPSRAALMSGMYQHRFGFEHNSGPERFADPNFGQPREVPTLAEKLKRAGYADDRQVAHRLQRGAATARARLRLSLRLPQRRAQLHARQARQ